MSAVASQWPMSMPTWPFAPSNVPRRAIVFISFGTLTLAVCA